MQQDLCLSVADASIQQQVLSCDQRSAIRQTSPCKDLNLFVMCSQVGYECSLHLLFATVAVFVHAQDHDKHSCLHAVINIELCPVGEGPCDNRSLPYWGLAICPALGQTALQC